MKNSIFLKVDTFYFKYSKDHLKNGKSVTFKEKYEKLMASNNLGSFRGS